MKKSRLAGQSFPNGILIKSKKNWALALENGDVQFGSSSSWLDHHPRLDIFFFRSVIAFFESIAFSYRMQRNLSSDGGRSFLRPLIYYLIIIIPISLIVAKPNVPIPWLTHVGLQIFSFIVAFYLFFKMLPGNIWSFHGAEHKVVHAHEQNIDLDDLDAIAECSRIHNRCGTNLVTFFAAASFLRLPALPPLASMVGTVGYVFLYVGICIELFRLVVSAPKFALSRMLLAPGRLLQKYVTTKEPNHDQLAVAVKATKTVLALDDMRKA